MAIVQMAVRHSLTNSKQSCLTTEQVCTRLLPGLFLTFQRSRFRTETSMLEKHHSLAPSGPIFRTSNSHAFIFIPSFVKRSNLEHHCGTISGIPAGTSWERYPVIVATGSHRWPAPLGAARWHQSICCPAWRCARTTTNPRSMMATQ